LTLLAGGPICTIVVVEADGARDPRNLKSNLKERVMGSTPFGDAAAMNAIAPALPQHIEIDRDGSGRVGVTGRT
jgi:hypothetical protein